MALLITFLMSLSTYLLVDSGMDHSQDIMQTYGDSVFYVYGDKGHGTGWLATTKSGKRVIVTNSHVCDMIPGQLRVRNYTHKPVDVTIIKTSRITDACLLTADGIKGRPLELASEVHCNRKNYSVGFPLTSLLTVSSGTISGMIDSYVDYNIPPDRCVGGKFSLNPTVNKKGEQRFQCQENLEGMMTTIPVDGGASGSPVFNSSGEVVGMIFGSAGNIAWGNAVPLRVLKDFLDAN